MGKMVRKFDILISCPSDVQKELDVIRGIVDNFNSTIDDTNDVILRTKHWETDSYAQSGGSPQDLLNE